MAEQKNQKPKYVDPNKFSDYGSAMAPVKGDQMAVEWQKTAEAPLAAATKPEALADLVKDAASAEALLAKIQGAYKTDPLTLTVIGAVSQYVMDVAVVGRPNGCDKKCDVCKRKLWNLALLAAFRKTKDEYIQTFLLDQLRWCCCKKRLDDLRALKANAVSENVKKYIDWAVAEVAGEMMPAK